MRSLLTTGRQLRKNHMGVGFKSQPALRFLRAAALIFARSESTGSDKDQVKPSPTLVLETSASRPTRHIRAWTWVLIWAGALMAHCNKLLRGWPRVYRYGYTLACGGEAVVEFKHYRRATLMTVSWRRPCRCQSLDYTGPEEWRRWKHSCELELLTWLAAIETNEAKWGHFRFPHEGSVSSDLGNGSTIILPRQ